MRRLLVLLFLLLPLPAAAEPLDEVKESFLAYKMAILEADGATAASVVTQNSRDYFRSDVKQALLEIFTSGRRRDGNPGLFHPDNFSFGQTIYLSPWHAAARQVRGVSSVRVLQFSRQGDDDPKPLADRYIQLGRLEIARLSNDPNFPEHGVLELTMLGGK